MDALGTLHATSPIPLQPHRHPCNLTNTPATSPTPLQPHQHPCNLTDTPATSPTLLQPRRHPCNLTNTPATSPTRQLFNCKISCHSGQGFDYIVESPLPNASQEHEHAPADFPGFVHVGAVDHGPLVWNMSGGAGCLSQVYHRRISTG